LIFYGFLITFDIIWQEEKKENFKKLKLIYFSLSLCDLYELVKKTNDGSRIEKVNFFFNYKKTLAMYILI